MKLHKIFNSSNTKYRIDKPLCLAEFRDTIMLNVKNINDTSELWDLVYKKYVDLFSNVTLKTPGEVPRLLGFHSQQTTLQYFTSRGWPLLTAQHKLKERQSVNSVKFFTEFKGLTACDAEAKVLKSNNKGIATLRARDDFLEICKAKGNSNQASYWVTRINPKTGTFYTEDEAQALVYEKQRKGLDKMWADVKDGKRIYYSNTMLEYYLIRGHSLSTAKEMLRMRQTTFSLNICISKLGKDAGLIRWQERQVLWQKTLNSLSDDKKREILEKKTIHSKRYSKEATLFIIELLDALGVDYLSDGVWMCDSEKFTHYQGKIMFFDLYVESLNLYLEYNGSCWHANPLKLDTVEKFNKWVNPVSRLTAKEQNGKDSLKREAVNFLGGNFFTVWDTDNKVEQIERIVKFFKQRKNESINE
jgi:hypothetical protein